MKYIILFLCTLFLGCRNEDTKEVTVSNQFNDYIDFRTGNIPLLIISVHGGDQKPQWIKKRTCQDAKVLADAFTLGISTSLEIELKKLGYSPYIIVNKLHREKLDLNRSLETSNCGDSTTEAYWKTFHNQIFKFREEIQTRFGKGLVIDIHGHGFSKQRIQLGYLLFSDDLRKDDEVINTSTYINKSSIKSLINNNQKGFTLSDLLRGPNSLGAYLTQEGYPTVPSPNDRAPLVGDGFFSGGHNTSIYGSKNGDNIDAIQIELNKIGLRDTTENREKLTLSLAKSIMAYLKFHYQVN